MRLIDADALDVLAIIGGRMDGKVEFAKAVNEMIQNAPTVDAVPVIRCKDCKRWDLSRINYTERVCYWDGYVKEEDDFCSWGEKEKKDNG